MKTVITAAGNTADSAFDRRFGRGAWFCVLNASNQIEEFIENVLVEASNGAGTKAAEKMVELGIGKVISGDFGPKAKDLLDKFEIQMVILQDESLTVQDIVNRFQHE